jgi:TonB family protein
MALADSLDFGAIRWVCAAPDGTCWLHYQTKSWFSALRRIEPGGRVATGDVLLNGLEGRPLAMLRNGDLLVAGVHSMQLDPPVKWARVGTGGLKATATVEDGWSWSYSRGTVLVDEDDVVHVFAGGRELDHAYLRYAVTDDTILKLGRRLFHDSIAWMHPGSGYKVVSLPDGPPWGLGGRAVMRWDSVGLAVGAALTRRGSETTAVFRVRLPSCDALDSVGFDAAAIATGKALGVACSELHIVKSGRDYWLFVPSTESVTIGRQKTPSLYSCHLDANLNPMRHSARIVVKTRPFAAAPPGSDVDVELVESYVAVPSSGPDRRAFTLRFIAFGSDGHVYCTEMCDTIVKHRDTLREAGILPVVGGGDSVGPVTVFVLPYPRMASDASIEGQATVSTFVNSNGTVDSVVLLRSSGNWSLDEAAKMAACKARFAGRALSSRTRPVACDLTYRFSLNPNRFSLNTSEVRVVEARLRQN